MGEDLPSVKAGKPYQIIGFQNAVTDFSTVAYPAGPWACDTCHDPKFGATQANAYLTQPNRAACGACHDNVNFATGENHANLPQVSDNQCSTCHIPKGELPYDVPFRVRTSAAGREYSGPDPEANKDFVPGMVFDNLQVQNGTAGNKPTITFTLKDFSGNGDRPRFPEGFAKPPRGRHGWSDHRLRLHEFRFGRHHGRIRQ